MLQRVLEHSLGVLPPARRRATERRLRGWLDAQRLKRADYVVVSFGKSGRTWVRVMLSRLYQLQHGLPEGTLLEFGNYHRLATAVPRILFTHDNYLRDYTGDGGSKRAYRETPVVLLVRHPADVAVSQYFQWKHRMRPHKVALNGYPPVGSDVSPYQFLRGPSGVPRVVAFMNEWARGMDEVHRGMVLRYEDLRADTRTELSRLARFLGAEPTVDHIAEAVEYASVENMKRREAMADSASHRLRAADPANPDSYKTRRAKVGGYRDYLEPREVMTIDALVEDQLDRRFGYSGNASGWEDEP